MPATAVQRRKFNPSEYKSEFLELAKANPELAADSATKLARRKRNAEVNVMDATEQTQNLLAFMGTMALMAAAGWWTGRMTAQRDALINDWMVEGAAMAQADPAQYEEPWDHPQGKSDPTKWWIMPKLLVFPLVTGIAAATAASRRSSREDAGTFERWMTMSSISTLGLFVATSVRNWVARRRLKELTVETVNSLKEAA